MRKLFTPLALTTFIFLQAVPAFSAGASRSMTFELSVTVPQHVMSSNALSGTAFSSNSFQLVQTETVVRDNQRINLTSIVVA